MQTLDIDWIDVKRGFLEKLSGERLDWTSQPGVAGSVRARGGHSLAELAGWIKSGYRSPLIQGSVKVPAQTMRRRARWNEEEGDLDLSRIQCGYDDYRLDYTRQPSKRGVRIECGFGFGGMVADSIITQYGAFLAGLIRHYEVNGFDLEVYIVSRKDRVFADRGDGRADFRIKVKNFGERTDFTSFSALFSPLGHRGLIWTAKGICADRIGRRISGTLGTPLHNGWNVSENDGIVKVECDRVARRNPTETLKASAHEAGIL